MARSKTILWSVLIAAIVPAVLGLLARWFTAWPCQSESLHSFLEVGGGFTALGVAFLFFSRLERSDASHLPWTISALFGMGLLDIAHGAWAYGAAWSWLRALGTAFGGTVFALVWVPERPRAPKRIIFASAATAAIIVILVGIFRNNLPAIWSPAGHYTVWPKAFNTLGAFGFLLAAIFFFNRYRLIGNREKLILGAHALLFATAGFLIWFSRNWYFEWWFWHGLRLAAYAVVAFAAYEVVASWQEQLRQHNLQLETRASARTAELQQSNARFQSMAETIPDLLFIFDLQLGRPTYCNLAVKQILGYSTDDVDKSTRHVRDFLIHPDDLPAVQAVFLKAHANSDNELLEYEHRALRKDGSWRWLRVRAKVFERDANAQLRKIIGVATDVTDARIAQERLRRSEQRLQTAVDLVGLGAFSWNPQTGEWHWDRRVKAMWGLPPHAPVDYEVFLSGIHPDDRARVNKGVKKALDPNGSGSYMAEYRVIGITDGVERWVSAIGRAGFDDGKPISYIGAALEITERKRVDQALRASEEISRHQLAELKSIYDSSGAGLAVLDCDLRFVRINKRLADINGVPAEQHIGKTVREVVPALADQAEALGRKIFRTGEGVRNIEFVGETSAQPGVTRIWIEHWLPIKSADGEVTAINLVAEEITERRRAQEALQYQFDLVKTITDNTPSCLWMIDHEGRCTFANPASERISGFKPEELIGKLLQKMVHPKNREFRLFSTVPAGSSDPVPAQGYEDTFVHKDGHAYSVRCNARPILKHGAAVGTVIEVQDISDIVRARQTLEERRQELEQLVTERTANLRDALNELEAFSYSIAHDMRAPLRGMHGFAKILEEDCGGQIGSEGRQYISRIIASAERLDRLIQDVLHYSRISRGELKLEPVNLETLTRDIINSYPQFAAPRVSIEITSPLPVVIGNPASLTQIISNILSNAVKFVAAGERSRVRLWAESLPLTFSPGEHWVKIWFEDNGIGIPREAQKRIFQIFQRVNRPELYEGTGIGLAVVRKAVERIGGIVGVESEQGKGSRFWVQLRVPSPE